MDAGGSDDIVSVGKGNAVIYGGDGNDIINAEAIIGEQVRIDSGAGNDRIETGESDDQIQSGAGNDFISAGNGRNTILAGDGSDFISGGAGQDIVFAGSGDDRVQGFGGPDELHGEDGDDTLEGGDGHDFLVGGAGDDRLSGDAGSDLLFGGNAAFTFVEMLGAGIAGKLSASTEITIGDLRASNQFENPVELSAGLEKRMRTGVAAFGFELIPKFPS